MYRPIQHSLLATIAALLLCLALTAPAQAQNNGAAGRTALGGSLTVAGIVMVPMTTEYVLSRDDFGTPFIALTIPTLMIPGIPTLILGTAQLAAGNSAVSNPAHLGAWGRAEAGKALALPYLLTGGLIGGIGLASAVTMGVNLVYNDAPSYILPALGFAVFGTGLVLTIDGDNAYRELWGKEDVGDELPGTMLLGGGVLCLSMGTGILAALTPLMRVQSYGTGNELAPVMVSSITGVAYMAGGIALLAAGASRMAVARSGQTTSPQTSRVRIDGFSPIYDPYSETTAVVLQGRF